MPAFLPALRGPLLLIAALSLLVASACTPPPEPEKTLGSEADPAPGPVAASPSATPAAHAAETLAWQEERAASITRPGGWLSLAGLFWLEEGENRFGAAEENDLVFPPPAPERAGTLVLRNGAVLLEPAAPGGAAGGEDAAEESAGLRVIEESGDGEEVTSPLEGAVRMIPDTEEGTTRIALGPLRFWVIERGGRLGVRLLDRESPAVAAFEGLDYFPVDPAWRVEARLDRRSGFTVAMPNVLGQVEDMESPGLLVFELDGEEHTLAPTAAGDRLFIVFGDRTNGRTTYGGGRFLYADAPAAGSSDGPVFLDFNRAYNPPCAFTPFATCPLPPPQNKLDIAIDAGEKAYAGHIEGH